MNVPHAGRSSLVIASLLLAGCDGQKDDTGTAPAETGDSSGTDCAPPCSSGDWGYIAHQDTAVHVSPDGSESGDGSCGDPVSTLEAALAITRERSEDRHIALWPGSYTGTIDITSADDGTILQGCSQEDVLVESNDSDESVFCIVGATDVTLEGITSRNGRRDIQVWSNATGIHLANIRIEEAIETGLLIHGNGTEATIENVEVHDTQTIGGGFGYGISFQEGATVTMTGGGAYNSVAVGLLVEDVISAEISGITVEGTEPDADGYYGRGVQFQSDLGTSTLSDSAIRSVYDAGVFVMEHIDVTVDDVTVEEVLASAIPDSDETSGDGIVITRGDNNRNPAEFATVVERNTVAGAERAGVVLDGVTTTLSDNTVSETDQNYVAQEDADVSGSDAGEVVELTGDEVLALNQEPLEPVDPTAHGSDTGE